MTKNVHVKPSNEGWDVREEGGSQATHFQTKEEAVRAGRKIARRNRSEHVIHDRDGRIRESDSYSRDPFPPR